MSRVEYFGTLPYLDLALPIDLYSIQTKFEHLLLCIRWIQVQLAFKALAARVTISSDSSIVGQLSTEQAKLKKSTTWKH